MTLMIRTISQRGLTCFAYAWGNQTPLAQGDERHAFRYQVMRYGKLIGYITADRARSHPDVKWDCSLVGAGAPFAYELDTVDEAFAAF